MGYFPRVYTSPTFVATPFPRILGSGAWQGFLGIRARFDIKENLVPTCNLRQLCWHCNIHILSIMILTPFGIDRPPFGNSILDLLISMIPTLHLEWFGCPSWFHLSFLFISPNSISWDWLLLLKPVPEIRARSGIVVSQRGNVEDCCVLSWSLILYHSLLYLNFEDEIFIKVGRM